MDRQALERLDDTGIGAWDSHRPDDFVDLLADDFVLRDTTIAEPITTKDGARQYVQAWLTACPDMRVHRTRRLIDGDGRVHRNQHRTHGDRRNSAATHR